MRFSAVASRSRIALIFGLALLQGACSSSDSSGTGDSRGGSGNLGGGGTGQAGGPTAGSSNASGGGGAHAGGAGTGGASGSATVAGSGGASAGTGGTNAGAGTGGTNPSGGSGGGAPVCTPGTGTTPVGTSSVLDQKTCLVWTKTRSAMTLTNKQAFKYCDDLNQDGVSDWRVPTPEELVTWPNLATADTAYITGPIYIPSASTAMDGCTGDSHSCNIAEYSDNNLTCAWQGVGFMGWVACVSGTATAGTTKTNFSAAMCSPCNGELSSFKVQDCSAYDQ